MTSGHDEIGPDVVAGIEQCLGDRVQHGPLYLVRVEGPKQRLDPKVMVLAPYRVFIMQQAAKTKIEMEFNYLEIHSLESTKPLQLQFHLAFPSTKVVKMTTIKAEDTRSIIEYILISLRKTFPMTNLDKMIPKICIQPPERSTSINNAVDRLTLPEQGPCGGFTQMYACMCDLHGETYQAEVAWDVDTIYLSQDSKELCLNDFDHLESKDLVPIVASLMYNSWFTKLTATNLKLSGDTCKEIKKVMTKSSAIEYLVLDNVGIRGDFAKELNTALIANPNTALRHIDLSNNLLEDRGVRHLAGEFTKLPNGLVTLRLAKIGMTAESTVQLGKALLENNFMPTSLLNLDLSGNQFKDGDINNLTQFLATPNAITHLDLSDTEIPLDNIFNALYRGCCANVSHLNLSGNVYSFRKNPSVPQTLKQYFATTTALKVLNLARNKLPPEVVKEVILGIGSNTSLTDVDLDLSSNELRLAGGRVVESCIANVPNITKLNLSDNDLNSSMSSLLDWISQNQVITSLDISQNLTSLRPGARAMMRVIDAIVAFIQNEETSITSLSVAGNKLKFETIQIINALGSNTTLTSVDLSGNMMGDLGARMLAKALMINTKLKTVALDNNGITAKGFMDIANALERNFTLKFMPTPVSDVSSALKSNSQKTQEALQRIQSLLQRNHSPHKFSDDQAFRLQQGFLYTTSHMLVDQLVVQIQDTSKDLAHCNKDEVQTDINTAKDIIADADNSKQLLAILHKVALDSEDSAMMDKLEEIVSHVQVAARKRLEANVKGMLEGASEQCSHMMKDSELRMEIETTCQEKKQLPERFMQDVMEQVSAAIFNRISEANLAVASIISDTIIDEIIEQLTIYHDKLMKHATDYGKGGSSYCNSALKINMLNGEKEPGDETDEKKEGDNEKSSLKPKKKKRTKNKKKNSKPSEVDEMVQDKRKSVKVRPRSSVVRHEYRGQMLDDSMKIEEEKDEGPQEIIVNGQEQEEPRQAPPIKEDAPDGAMPSKPVPSVTTTKATPKKEQKKTKTPQLDNKAFDELTQNTQQPLQDVRKSRPRRPGMTRPTRAGITPHNEHNPHGPKDEEKVDAGLDDFYKPAATEASPIVGKAKLSGSSNSLDTKEEKKTFGGKLGGLFKKKPKTPKQEKQKSVKEEPKPKPVKKPTKEGRGLFNKSKKKDQPPDEIIKPGAAKGSKPAGANHKQESASEEDPTMSSSGDELERDMPVADKETPKAEEAVQKEEPEEKEAKLPLKPPGARAMPGMGMGGGGKNILAEMKQQQDRRRSSNKALEEDLLNKKDTTPDVKQPEKIEEKEEEKPAKAVDEEKVEEKEESTVKEDAAKEDSIPKEDESPKEEKEASPVKEDASSKEESAPTETDKTPETDKSQENKVPLTLSLNMPSDASKRSSLNKPPSPGVSPKPRSPTRLTPSPTKSPYTSPRTSGLFSANQRASADIAKAFRDRQNENEEKKKVEEKKEDEKKEEAEPSSNDIGKTSEDQDTKPEVQLRKSSTPRPLSEKRKSIPIPTPDKRKSAESEIKDEDKPDEESTKPEVKLRQSSVPSALSEKRKSLTLAEKRKSNPPLAEKRKSGTPENLSVFEKRKSGTSENLPVMEKRKSGPPENLLETEKRKSGPPENLSVFEKRKSGPPENLSVMEKRKSGTQESLSVSTPEKEEAPPIVNKSPRNSLKGNDNDTSQETTTKKESPTASPRAATRSSIGNGGPSLGKPKPTPSPRPMSKGPPPTVKPRPKVSARPPSVRDGPKGFNKGGSTKSPPSTGPLSPVTPKPRSKSLDTNFALKSSENADGEEEKPMNGDANKETMAAVDEDEDEDSKM